MKHYTINPLEWTDWNGDPKSFGALRVWITKDNENLILKKREGVYWVIMSGKDSAAQPNLKESKKFAEEENKKNAEKFLTPVSITKVENTS